MAVLLRPDYAYCAVHLARALAQLDAMSRLRLILGAGACSVALGGCIPAAAGLALSAAQLVAGGGAEKGSAFRNPIDRHSTGRQVREALSRLDDQVDPACQAMLDERQKASAGAQEMPATGEPEDAPRNLLAKLDAQDGGQAASDSVRTAPSAGLAAGGAEVRLAAAGPESESVRSAAPGQCEHRLVCLPGTPKPTVMLMCPGRGGGGKGGNATAAGDTTPGSQGGEAASVEAATAASEQPEKVAAPVTSDLAQPPAPARGVSDWNWAYDPTKRL